MIPYTSAPKKSPTKPNALSKIGAMDEGTQKGHGHTVTVSFKICLA